MRRVEEEELNGGQRNWREINEELSCRLSKTWIKNKLKQERLIKEKDKKVLQWELEDEEKLE